MSTPPEEDLTHPRWELIDPTPDVHALFKEFDRRFFNERLINQCYLTWSPRMTTCAGICKYEGTNHYGMCTISLSKPLLTLRPRSDLVETLLHEMIHAYLFITEGCRNRDGADGHGPRFQEHMYRINRTANTNITIYHSFHQEVAHYKRHVWRCNGPCRARAPYFGFVRRATNRAPGRNDPWFASHQTTCHGTFVKIKEPELSGNKAGTSGTEKGGNAEKKPRKRPSKEEVQNSPSKKVNKPLNTLDNYFTGQSSSGSISVSGSDVNFVGGMVNSGSMDISNTKIFNSGNSNISSVGSVNFNNAKSMNSGNINITSHDIRNKLRSVWGNQMTSTSEPTIIELDSDFDGDNDDIEVIRRGGLSPRTMLRNVWGNK